jgi:hypothetical protein
MKEIEAAEARMNSAKDELISTQRKARQLIMIFIGD